MVKYLFIFLTYIATGWLGLQIPYVGSHITLIWLPTGIAVAALHRWGLGVWPGIYLGAFLVNLIIGSPWPLAAGIAVGNTLGPLITVLWLKRVGFHQTFDRRQDIGWFIAAANAGMAVSALNGVMNLYFAGLMPPAVVGTAWLTWWMGDVTGVLLAAPLLLTLTRTTIEQLSRNRKELLLWTLVVSPLVWLAFIHDFEKVARLPLAFLTFPPLAWAALRFGNTGAALAGLVFSLVAAWSTGTGHGTFALPDMHLSLFLLWSYMAITVFTVLLISVLQAERIREENTRKQAESQLHEALVFNEVILHNSPVAMGVYRGSGPCVLANQAYATMAGATRDQLLKQNFRAILTWQQSGLLDDCLATLADGKQRQRDGHVTTSFGKEIWVESIISQTILHGEEHLLAQFFDRTEQKCNEDALRESEDRLAMALDATSLSIWDIDFRTDIVHLDRQWASMMDGVPGVTITTGTELTRLTHQDDVERAVIASLAAIKGDSDNFQAESRLETASGNWKWIKCSGKVVERDTNGRAVRAIGTNLDVTERRTADEKIRELAYYDTVTNLPNRRLMLDRLKQALAQSKRFGHSLAILFLDLDHFKNINDTLGHDAGDEVLKWVAGRLVGCIRSDDTVSRQGGDEFVIVLTKIREPADASRVAEKILKVLEEPVRIAGQELKLTVSIGVSVYPLNGIAHATDLMKKADIAMYAAKKAGRNTYRVFKSDNITAE